MIWKMRSPSNQIKNYKWAKISKQTCLKGVMMHQRFKAQNVLVFGAHFVSFVKENHFDVKPCGELQNIGRILSFYGV
jgi:hypothetical protein